ncbi:MAG: efflux RND transporter periplasmic adaptor subunit [Chakrabartia sp.]
MRETIFGFLKTHPIWSTLLGLFAAFILYWIIVPDAPDYEYVSAAVDQGEVARKVTASGKLRALNTIKVGAEVSGQVTKVYVDFNSRVTAGQVLAEIDPTRARSRVLQVEAQVAVARAALTQAEANAARARTDIGVQEREYTRRKSLASDGFISSSGLDAASNQLASARASIKTTQAQISSARAQIAQSNAELSSAQLDVRRTVITAPSSGVIINKLVEPGTTVAANFQTPNLFEIAADTTRMQVEASVDEADIGQVRDGQSVQFTVDAYPDDVFRAQVRQIRKAATETQNVVSYFVILDVNNEDGRLLPGMTANVEIITGKKTNVSRVPTTALRFRPRAGDRPEKDKLPPEKASVVYIVSDDPFKPTPRVVTLGLIGEEYAEIIKGLGPKDRVVLRARSLKKKSDAETDAADEEADDAATS